MLSHADHDRIAAAVSEAEDKTSGEILCVLQHKVSDYREVPLAWAAGASLIVPALLAAFGLLMGIATAPVLAYYASTDPQVLWQSGAATALFIAGFGAAGYATRRDLTAIARIAFWALLALIVFGIVLIFVVGVGIELLVFRPLENSVLRARGLTSSAR